MSRVRVARWLLEKLLGSFIISVIFVYGPFIGVRFSEIGIGYIYAIIAGVNIGVYILVYLLVPGEIKVVSRVKSWFKGEGDESEYGPLK
jgi:hypothetical protein